MVGFVAGTLAESNAIARYIARIRRDTELFGRTFFENAQVDSWIDFASHDLELAITLWVYPIIGWAEFNPKLHEQAVNDVHRALAVLEKHLLSRTYLVGEAITLADIVVVSVLFYAFKLVFGAEVRDTYPSVTRWFYTAVNQPQFAAVLGDVPIAHTVMTAKDAPPSASGAGAKAKEAKPKAEKAEKPKAEKAEKPKAEKAEKPKAEKEAPAIGGVDPANAAFLDEAPKEKKKDPFAGLAKSPMDLDEWKRTYSNSKTDFYAVMPWFWEHLDREGYSLWQQKYKFNSENTRDFMTSNLISGFVQRSDEVRRYAFGVMMALGDKAPYEVCTFAFFPFFPLCFVLTSAEFLQVEGAWMIRGQDIKPLLEANDDAEYHEWVKLDPANPEHQKLVADYWCAPEKVFGKPIMDSKCFK
jgi:elongation factor 1-gamma